jgi:hypothetical protein
VDGGRQYTCIWDTGGDLGRGERWHRRTEERRDIAGGAIERYREGKREREEITASNKHMRDVFVLGDLQPIYFL